MKLETPASPLNFANMWSGDKVKETHKNQDQITK